MPRMLENAMAMDADRAWSDTFQDVDERQEKRFKFVFDKSGKLLGLEAVHETDKR